MSNKNICLVVWIIFILISPLVADNGLERQECFKRFDKNFGVKQICLSRTTKMDHWPTFCDDGEVPKLSGLFLHTPKNQTEMDRIMCNTNNNKFYYNATYNASCLMEVSPVNMKKLLLLIMDGFSNRKNFSYVAQKFIDENLFGLPEYTLLDLTYDCANGPKHSAVTPFLDICENISYPAFFKSQIFFNITSYSNSVNTSTCFCKVTPTKNQSDSTRIKALDVRLAGGAILNLSDAKTMILDDSKLLWGDSDTLLTSDGEITIELTKINPSALPHSMWLEIEGQDLNIKCGVQHRQDDKDLKNIDDNNSFSLYIIVAGIVGGILALTLIIIIFGRCVCKRSRGKKEKYAVVSSQVSDLERVNSPTPSKSYQLKEESMDTYPETSNIYFEVQPRSDEDKSSNDSIRSVTPPTDAKKKYHIAIKNGEEDMTTSQKNHIYSHLREARNDTPTDLYDTIGYNEYSSLQRMQPKNVTGNIYNT